jgi:hypothetical protein
MRTNTLVILLGLPLAAYGYTDPGTGIFLYQAIIATLVGTGWTARRFITRLFTKDGSDKVSAHRVAEDQ